MRRKQEAGSERRQDRERADVTRKQVLGTEAEAERRGVQAESCDWPSPATGRVLRDDRGPGAHQGSELLHRTTTTRECGEAEAEADSCFRHDEDDPGNEGS